MGWTPEQDARLTKYANEGFSASVTATMMGISSRNAVIGRAFRIGVQFRSGPNQTRYGPRKQLMQSRPKRGPYKKRADAQAKATKAKTPRKKRRWFTFHYDPKANRPEDKTAPVAISEVPLPDNLQPARATGAAAALIALERDDCRWGIGDPQDPAFRFCGARKEPGGSAYCSYHRAASIGGGWYGSEEEDEGERQHTVEGN